MNFIVNSHEKFHLNVFHTKELLLLYLERRNKFFQQTHEQFAHSLNKNNEMEKEKNFKSLVFPTPFE